MLKSHFQENLNEAGCDEVGRGCLAGPVVAAAVIFEKNYKNKNIIDSKKLTAQKRKNIEIEIKKDAVCWAVASLKNELIDKYNILNASIFAMHKALNKLKIKPEFIIVDGNKFKKYKQVNHECIIKGDNNFLSIAAASIIAKNYRDNLMIKLSKKYNQYLWNTNFGYPTKAHREAIRKFGITKYHRKSFKLL
tara:strand:- start:1084 stop:1659 length:576 start_codon:yes stop_codon:yes gene_type:complete